ncbi:MAG: DUF4157 domain-containing protein [Rubritepida sp.]|nr:DUF4157 domain-containing protein [Rubritepida sp.]
MNGGRAAEARKAPAPPVRVGGRHEAAEQEADGLARRLVEPGAALGLGPRAAPFGGSPGALPLPAGAPLPGALRARFEERLGAPLGGLRLHRGAEAAGAARAVGARAFHFAGNIVLGEHAPAPETAAGERLLAHEVAHALQPDAGRVLRRDGEAPPAEAARPPPPIQWGRDTTSNRVYVSVLGGGRRIAEVAAYVYGSEASTAALQAENPGASDPLPAGSVLRLAEGTLSEAARVALQAGLDSGTILRTPGIPDSLAGAEGAPVHRLTINGQPAEFTEPQFQALLRGWAFRLTIEANRVHGYLQGDLETRNWHEEGSNSLVRGISDLVGGVDLPEAAKWAGPIARADALIDRLRTTSPDAALVQEAAAELASLFGDHGRLHRAWRVYIEGTISGAEATAAGLEVVRDTCFAIEAGLAGAVIAPVAFAAAGTALAGAGVTGTAATVLATGAGIGAGAAGGGLLRGTLDVALPGMMADRPAEERFVHGFGTGALQGGLGAAGAFAAPGVAGALAPRLGITAGAVPTAGQALALRMATGAALGLPSGALSSGITNLGDFASGRISGEDYLLSILAGTALGGLGGGAFGALRVDGLYRSGGGTLGVFRGTPVMPRWMLAGPLSPLQPRWAPPPEFNRLAPGDLPPVPEGYGWARMNGVWEPVSLTGANRMELTLRVYGPDAAGRNNFNILTGRQLVQSSAVTQSSTFQGARNYPMTTADYVEPTTGRANIRGHNVDHADTITGAGVLDSTSDPLNYTPEPSWWGLYLRNFLVNRVIRPAQGGYRQMNFYGPNPRLTANGTPIPDGVYFVQTDQSGAAVRAWRIPFTAAGPTRSAQLPQFEVPVASVPPGLRSPTPSPGLGGAGSAAATAERREAPP